MSTPSRRPSAASSPPAWPTGQRRMFLLVVIIEVCASLAALWSQAPAFDTLDVWALPLLSVTMLAVQLLLARGVIRFETAISVAFVGACLYLLLALSHQFDPLPAGVRRLSENTYWFAVLYTSIFYIYPPRRAANRALLMLGISTVICGWHLLLTVPPEMQLNLLGATAQFLLSSSVLILIQATFGLQRAQLLASRSAALIDVLTGVANRRAAEERLRELSVKRATYTVVLFDLDHFKQINDRHGHATGDQVLRGVAQLARDLLPQNSVVARWGGEEFLLILPALGDTQVRKLLNNLRNEIRQQRHGDVVGVTASFGVASADAGESSDAVVARADEAMYSAKKQGRNDIRLAEWRRNTVN
ncbi:diguanylate cyclase domain-containing protein [Deinococcus sp. SM5_A1]|uniref:GGDEF domain-containing protein n=1 Tax=Deinococcus sp. SM5_A1 TaxID=3379094 RepID=UPI003859C9D7